MVRKTCLLCKKLVQVLNVDVIHAGSGNEALGLVLEHDFFVAILGIPGPVPTAQSPSALRKPTGIRHLRERSLLAIIHESIGLSGLLLTQKFNH